MGVIRRNLGGGEARPDGSVGGGAGVGGGGGSAPRPRAALLLRWRETARGRRRRSPPSPRLNYVYNYVNESYLRYVSWSPSVVDMSVLIGG